MIRVITKDSPQILIDKLNAYINSKSTNTWKIDEDGDFNVCIIESKKNPMTKKIYSVYHCRFAEMLLESFDLDIVNVEITSMLIKGHDKYIMQ